MGISYLYIKEWKNIKGQEFNFDREYSFNYNREYEHLEILKNDLFVSDFFGNSISNFNAIIGENGTGKSALLEFILSEVSIGKYNQWRKEFIIVLDNKTIWHHKNLKIQEKEDGWEIKEFPYSNENNSLDGILFFYYSNYFDGSIKPFQEVNNQQQREAFYDLSTNSWFDFLEKSKNKYESYPKIYNYRYREINSNIKFILGWRGEIQRQKERGNNKIDKYKIPFNLPKYIKLEASNYIDLEFLINAKTDKGYIIDRHFVADVKNIYNYLKSQQTFKHNLVLSILFGFFNQTPRISVLQGGNYAKIYEELSTHDLSRPEELIKYIQDFGSTQKMFLPDLLDVLDRVLRNEAVIEKEQTLIMELTNENEQQIKAILDFIEGIYIRLSIPILFDWGYISDFKEDGMSSGEKSWLTLFSRFWKHKDNLNIHGNRSLVILLDEPEIGFHPNWQRKMVEQLIDFISVILGWIKYSGDNNSRKIQLIITSHSPFIVSDLPKTNVIFLSKDKDGRCKVSEGVEMQNTLAANIHTLFSDAFFMKEGTIGSFAKKKIDETIKILKKDLININSDEKQQIKNTIELIGEPIIKKKLLQMLESKVGANLITLEQRIQELEEKVKKINEGDNDID